MVRVRLGPDAHGGPLISPFWDEPLPLCRTAKPSSITRKSQEPREARPTATKGCLSPSTFRVARRGGWLSGILSLGPGRNDSRTIWIWLFLHPRDRISCTSAGFQRSLTRRRFP